MTLIFILLAFSVLTEGVLISHTKLKGTDYAVFEVLTRALINACNHKRVRSSMRALINTCAQQRVRSLTRALNNVCAHNSVFLLKTDLIFTLKMQKNYRRTLMIFGTKVQICFL